MIGNTPFSLYLMSTLYVIAGAFHFVAPRYYKSIMPPWIPRHDLMIFLSGVAEVLLGVLLLFDQTRSLAAWAIILMLICFLPVHLHMLAGRKNDFKKYPASFLWGRPLLQILLAYWAFLYT